MLDPFTAWLRLSDAALAMARTTTRAAETLAASGDVVAKRSHIMDSAMRNPLSGDYAELGRMVPEKVEAFSKAGMAMAREMASMQSAYLAELQNLGKMTMRGRPPTVTELTAFAARTTSYAVHSVERFAALGAIGLAPVHKQATANARRLK